VNILVVDNNAMVLEVVALMLTSEGYRVRTAGSGCDALARLEAGESVDLVLTDLSMPGMNGWDLVRAVRNRWPAVRVWLLTGVPLDLLEHREPVDALLTKPITIEGLRETIARLDLDGRGATCSDTPELPGSPSESQRAAQTW
jgi:CheY-like chemotaxis protein